MRRKLNVCEKTKRYHHLTNIKRFGINHENERRQKIYRQLKIITIHVVSN
ncbi:hypothetical protein CoNPh26_CDS0038 [Staphylococcus phage S-CoN_Ph26]|nr:hypothetical protein CoNPh26_CDS0038 [Staphylococcus phage S-CoN_Ph26]